MLSRLQTIPSKWKWSVVFLLVLVHALPFLFTTYLLWPTRQATLETVSKDLPLSFLQANSTLFAEYLQSDNQLPTFKITLKTHSQTNQSTSIRQDITLLYQDGILIAKNAHKKKHSDLVMQQVESHSKFHHLFQAISFHYAETENQTPLYQMSDDYLYVSATKFGGIQAFHHPETVQQQNWKQIMDRTLHQLLNFEYNEAFQKLEIDPNKYYLFPLTQLPSYNMPEQLPGIPAEYSAETIRKIWNILHEHIVLESNTPTLGSSLPLLLFAKDGTSFTVLYRTKDGQYHEWNQPVREDFK